MYMVPGQPPRIQEEPDAQMLMENRDLGDLDDFIFQGEEIVPCSDR